MTCHIGNCRDVLPRLAAEGLRVQTCVTSPPYWGLRDYGVESQLGLEATPEEFIGNMVEVFRAVRDVLADDGTLWVNMGDAYAATQYGSGGRWAKDDDPRYDKGQSVSRRSTFSDPGFKAGLRPKNLIGMPWRLALALQADGWYLRQDIIWCLSGGARVYVRTKKGDMPMTIKDMVRLDPSTVKLWNGNKWTQALGWSRSQDSGGLEIELRSGECIGCTEGHVWPTTRGNVSAKDLRPGDVILGCELPEPDDLHAPLNIDTEVAWFLGLYLAEGSKDLTGTIQLAGHADESASRLDRIEPIVRAFGGTVRVHLAMGKSASIAVECAPLRAIVEQYIHGNNARNKGLKVRCWRHGNNWLRALFDGYLQGDGHEEPRRWRLGFTRNDRLAADFRTLAARLGGYITLKKSTAKAFGRNWPTYLGEYRAARTGHHNEKARTEVVEIRNSRARQYWDIGVEDDPHLFALASGVLTHNSKPNPMPESVTDRCTKAHEYIFLLTKRAKYYYDAGAIKEDAKYGFSETKGDMFSSLGSASTIPRSRGGSSTTPGDGGSRNKRSVWTVPSESYAGAHFATFPQKLIEPCILAGSRTGDTVLDPFFGSGTTGQVAERLGRKWIGIELNPEYIALANQRTAQTGLCFT